MRTLPSCLAVVVLCALGACTGGEVACTADYRYGLTVTVVDEAGAAICDATVTITDGDYEETLENVGGDDCAYVGAGERAGTYAITAEKAGYQTASESGVVVDEDECHVIAETVELTLTEA